MYQASGKNQKTGKFAVKIVSIENMSEHTKEQMHEELNVLNKLDHPYVAKYEESYEDERYIYIIMNNIKGHHILQDVKDLQEAAFYDEVRSRNIMYKIFNAIHHIHSSGIIHRDLKPENIMIDEADQPVIIDFGLSKDMID